MNLTTPATSSNFETSVQASLTTSNKNNPLSELPNEILDKIVWKIDSTDRKNLREVNQLLNGYVDHFLHSIYKIFRIHSYTTLPFSHKNVENYLAPIPYRPQSFASLEVAKFYTSQVEFIREQLPVHVVVSDHISMDFYIEASKERDEGARLWIQTKFNERSKLNLQDDPDKFARAKIYCALADIYLGDPYSKDSTYLLLASENYREAWMCIDSLAKKGKPEAISYFYNKRIGEISAEENTLFFNKLLDQHLLALSINDKAAKQASTSWILSIFKEEDQLPSYYQQRRETALLGIVQSMNSNEGLVVGDCRFEGYSIIRSAIENKLQRLLGLPGSVKFHFHLHDTWEGDFLIYTDKTNEAYDLNLKMSGLFKEDWLLHKRDGMHDREIYYMMVDKYSWNDFKKNLGNPPINRDNSTH